MNNKVIMYMGLFFVVLGFFFAYGVVGALDNEAISLKDGIIGVSLGFAITACGGFVAHKGGSYGD